MNKKNLRFYEAPMTEVVELKACSIICASDGTQDEPTGAENAGAETL